VRGSEENKPPEHQILPEPAGNDPRVAQPGQADGGPKVEAGEPDPKTQRSKPDRYTFITAGISALAALAGALIGGISSYLVAQSNNAAEVEAAQISKKETTYADFITSETDLLRASADVSDHYRLNPGDTAEEDQVIKTYGENYSKWLHTDFIVRVVDSPAVDSVRNAIYEHILIIKDLNTDLADESAGKPPKPMDKTITKLRSEYDVTLKLESSFTQAAKNDVTPSKRKLLSSS
jgi:hypothetical protein